MSCPARHFFYNYGFVEHDDRMGICDTIQAFSRLPRSHNRLSVRLQKNKFRRAPVDEQVEILVGNLPSVFDVNASGDICVKPLRRKASL